MIETVDRASIDADLKAILTEAEPLLQRGSREDLASIRRLSLRLLSFREHFQPGCEIRGAMWCLELALQWWRAKHATRRAWAYLHSAVNQAEVQS